MRPENSIVMSVYPQYAKGIMLGDKDWEIRKSVPDGNPKRAYIYMTASTVKDRLNPDYVDSGGVVGYARIKNIVKMPTADLWNVVADGSMLSFAEYTFYARGRKNMVGINLADPVIFKRPVSMSEFFPDGKIPQSFRWYDDPTL